MNLLKRIYKQLICSFFLFSFLGFHNSSLAYDQVRIFNYANVPATANIIYAGCRHDTLELPPAAANKDAIIPSWQEVPAGHYEQHHTHISRWWKWDSPRGGCLVTRIDINFQGGNYSVDSYRSSGTSYSEFHILQRSASRFRVMSKQEMNQPDSAEMSPGFKIHNRSTIPLTISLDQVGCLYYQNNVQPGGTFDRNTGAVWFTIRAKLFDVNHQTTDWACAEPVLEYVGAALVAAFTAGYGDAIYAAVFGSEVATAAGGAAVAGEAVAANSAFTTMLKEAVKKWALSGALIAAGTVAQKNYTANTATSKAGEYAGPPFPFRCTLKPEYAITGGPDWSLLKGAKTDEEMQQKITEALSGNFPLKITKLNSCGSDN